MKRVMKRQYKKWKVEYSQNLDNLYDIFLKSFKDVEIINKTKWNTFEHFDIFCKFIYGKSK